MNNNNLPTDDLKKYGIIDENNSFSKKLSEKEKKFLQIYNYKNNEDLSINLKQQEQRINLEIKELEKDILKWDAEYRNPTKLSAKMNRLELDLHIENLITKHRHKTFDKEEIEPLLKKNKMNEDLRKDITENLQNNSMDTKMENPIKANSNNKFDQNQILDYLKNQLKYLGFGDDKDLHQKLEKGITETKANNNFQINTQSNKAQQGNEVNFILDYHKSDSGVFLNSFKGVLKTNRGEEKTHSFGVSNFTAKEAINLLEGRAVKTELTNKQGEKYEAFAKLNFEEEKNEYGNYKLLIFNKNYGVNTSEIVDKAGLKFDKEEYKENAIKSLEKGNIIKAKFELDGKEIEGKAVLNVQYKNINLYDNEMNRLNTNKPLQGLERDNSHEKNNIRQQNISRSL